MKLLLILLFSFLLSCSFSNTGNYWNENLNSTNENLDFNKDYTIKEYEKILNRYNDRTNFPDIN